MFHTLVSCSAVLQGYMKQWRPTIPVAKQTDYPTHSADRLGTNREAVDLLVHYSLVHEL